MGPGYSYYLYQIMEKAPQIQSHYILCLSFNANTYIDEKFFSPKGSEKRKRKKKKILNVMCIKKESPNNKKNPYTMNGLTFYCHL